MTVDPYRAQLPQSYGDLLDWHDQGLEPEVIAHRLGVEVASLAALRDVAIAKLERLRHQHRSRPDADAPAMPGCWQNDSIREGEHDGCTG